MRKKTERKWKFIRTLVKKWEKMAFIRTLVKQGEQMGKKWKFIRTPVKQWKNYTQVWEKKKEKKVGKRKKNVEIYEHASETMEGKNPFTTRLEAV